MAQDIIFDLIGEEFIKQAEEKYNAKASKILTDEIDTVNFNGELPISLIDLLFELKLVESKSEARRLIIQNGISINQVKETDIDRIITKEDFINGFIIIQKGKKQFKKIIVK